LQAQNSGTHRNLLATKARGASIRFLSGGGHFSASFREGGRNSYFSAANRIIYIYICGPKKNLRASPRGRLLKSGISLIVRTSKSPQHILRVGNRRFKKSRHPAPGAAGGSERGIRAA
jgi:hypothetical protein